jgi:hypothetical protein
MRDNSDVHLPVELGPIWDFYVMVGIFFASPAIFWLANISLGKKMSIQFIGPCLAGALLLALYFKNKTLHLDAVGISQGYSMFRTFIPYETVAGVHREVRSGRRASTTVLVVTKKNSEERIVIYVRSFDQIKLAHLMATLAHKAPQAHIEDALYIQFNP